MKPLALRNVHSVVSEDAWLRMYREDARREQSSRCAYCWVPITREGATGDHARARANGGSTRRENIKAACRPCNWTKGAQTEKSFLARIKNPKPGDSIHIWMAWSRRRIWLATKRACERITRAAI